MRNWLLLITTIYTATALHAQETVNIPFQGGSIHTEVYGKGMPLLIINGGPGMSSEGFRPLAKKLGEKYKAIIFDQRGTGQTKLGLTDSINITMDAMATDIERIRSHFKIKKWAVMGHSFGGMLAAHYATKHPNPILALILSSSGGINLDIFDKLDVNSRLSTSQRDSLVYWTNKIAMGDTTYHARLQRGRNLAPAYLYDQSHAPAIAERLTQGNTITNRLVYNDLYRIKFDCTQALKGFKQPVLIVQGKADIVPVSISEYAHQTLPNTRLHIIDECGHYGWLEQPKTYFGLINGFLSKINFKS